MVQRYTFSVKYKKKLVIFEEKLYFCNRKGVIMDKKYISFSKLLSRRILMISIATFAVIALLVTAFANDIQQKMTDSVGTYIYHPDRATTSPCSASVLCKT